MSKSPVTLESLVARVKKEVAERQKHSDARKLEAKLERLRRQPEPSAYQREDYWYPVAIHREYETQLCDVCKTETTYFNRDKVELRHKFDRSARRFIHERGEGMQDLPTHIEILERVIPECFACLTAGKLLNHLFRKEPHAQAQPQVQVESRPLAHAGDPGEGGPLPAGQSPAQAPNELRHH